LRFPKSLENRICCCLLPGSLFRPCIHHQDTVKRFMRALSKDQHPHTCFFLCRCIMPGLQTYPGGYSTRDQTNAIKTPFLCSSSGISTPTFAYLQTKTRGKSAHVCVSTNEPMKPKCSFSLPLTSPDIVASSISQLPKRLTFLLMFLLSETCRYTTYASFSCWKLQLLCSYSRARKKLPRSHATCA